MDGREAPVRDSFWADRKVPRKDAQARARARRVGFAGFVLALALPVALFHSLVSSIASEFRLDFTYLVAEWFPWVLIAAGLAFAAPVVWSAGRDPHSRWYPRSRNAYAGWASVLYILGMALGVQVAAVAGTL
ncbi:MAG TPA: hypothetical protein VNB64_02360 [Solirubrobacteraceae bacterium]|nr:hypothetical protein [Solirubrobacteraceae bacterium]